MTKKAAVYRREPQADDLYEIGEWRGAAHYRCKRCAFDTLDAGNMLAHLGSHAGSEPAQQHLESTEVENANSG